MSTPAPYHGTPAPYLDAIGESMWAAGIYAEQGQRYVEIGDLAGLAYTIRCLTAHVRMAVSTMADLREVADGQRAGQARADSHRVTENAR